MSSLELNQMADPRSPFLPAPRELRDLIYEHLLTTTFSVENPRTEDAPSSLPLHRHPHLAILCVSKSTHEEAKEVLCIYGHFRFNAISAGSPPLHEEIGKIQAVTLLQNITLRLDGAVAERLGYDKTKFFVAAKNLVEYFAKLDYSVPRKRCVVEMEFFCEFIWDVAVAEDMFDAIVDFQGALGSLAGFNTVILKQLQNRPGEVDRLNPYFELVFDHLRDTLGQEERTYEEGRACSIYRPPR